MRPRAFLATLAWMLAVPVHAVEFATREEIAVGGGVRAMAAARFNADNITDFVLASDRGLVVLLGARGILSSATTFRDPSAPVVLATGDFDGDRRDDVASASLTEQKVRVRYGDGDGGFAGESTIPTSDRVFFLHAADVDRDGRSELFVGHAARISLLRSQGRGQFAAPELVDTQGVEGRWFTTLDLDGDGQLDLLVLEPQGEAIGFFQGDGHGNFVPRQASYLGREPHWAAFADFDGDGALDVVAADYAGVVWLRGNRKGEFSEPVRLLRSDDIAAVAAFDANADGTADIAAIDRRRGVVHVLLNTGAGKFERRRDYSAGPMPEAILPVDIQGDAVPDLLIANRLGGALVLCRGRGDGTFQGLPVFDLGPDPSTALAYDANADGHLDLAIAHRDTGTVTLSFGDGHGNFRLHRSMPVGSDPRALALGDFNADGAPDLVAANFASDDIAILASTVRGELAAPLFVATGLGPTALAVADFDHDGHDDIAVANSLSNSVSVVFSDGQGKFPRTLNYAVLPKPEFLLAGDVGGNGSLDLIAGNARAERVSILRAAPGGLQEAVDGQFGKRVQPVVSADFDGDGITDVVRVEEYDDRVAILAGTANHQLASPQRFRAGRQPTAAIPGDYDEDRKPDLVLLHRRTRLVTFMRNITPNFGSQAAVAPTRPSGEVSDPWQRAADNW